MATLSEAFATAVAHHQAGRLDLAAEIYRRILAVAPTHADALHLLGVVAHQTGQHAVAVDYIGRAVSLLPTVAVYYHNLGEAYRALQNTPAAIDAYRRALTLNPNFPEALNGLGLALQTEGQLAAAMDCYQRTLQLRPDDAEATNNLARAFKEQGKLSEAAAWFQRAIELKPQLAEAHVNLGVVYKDQGRLAAAIACYQRAVTLKPQLMAAHSSLLYTYYFTPGLTSQAIGAAHRRWNEQFTAPLGVGVPPYVNERSPERRLRIGYVSPNFYDHVVGRNVLPLLREHDRRQYEVFCYSNLAHGDQWTERFRTLADGWRDVAYQSDAQLVDQIRADRIDILVDLALHMAGNRLLVFARKPAPVTVTFAGYPGTTGLTAIDYRLTDPYLDPPGVDPADYAEQSIRLPDTFWCYDPLGDEPAVGGLPAAAAGRVTFGCLNNFCKVNDEVLRLWAQVLAAVAGSRLVLLAGEGPHRADTLAFLAQQGVTSDRVVFHSFRPRAEYLQLYQQIDVGLDTAPYNGHTTSLDALWMGVPVVSLVGQTVVGRAGVSQLTNLGLTEWIAQTPEQFVRIASELAHDLPRLAELRATLRQRMQRSPLMDAPRFTRHVEAAYRTMWRRWCGK
jgi:protein O-GlcNAc transferase